MSDKFYNPDDDVITTSHNDKVKLKQLEDDVFRLEKEAKQKDKMIQDYEEIISKSSIQNISNNDFTNEDILNIMINQSVIINNNNNNDVNE